MNLSEYDAFIITVNTKQKLVEVCTESVFLPLLWDLLFVAELVTCNSDLDIELHKPQDNSTGIF